MKHSSSHPFSIHFLLFIFLFLFLSPLFSQVPPKTGLLLAPVQQPVRYGLKDIQGNILIPARFEALGSLTQGVARAKQKGRWGFVDNSGTWIVQPRFDDLEEMKAGFAVAGVHDTSAGQKSSDGYWAGQLPKTNLRFGIIDSKGQWKIKPTYTQLILCENGLIIFPNHNYWGVMNLEEKVLVSARYDAIFPYNNGVAVMVNKSPSEFSMLAFYDYSEHGVVTGGKWGLLDEKGKEILAPSFSYIGSFSEGVAPFNTGGYWKGEHGYSDEKQLCAGQWGYLDVSGKVAISAKYESVGPFHDGIARVTREGMNRYLQRHGIELNELLPDTNKKHNADLLPDTQMYCEPASWGFVDTAGSMVIAPAFGEARPFREGFAAVAQLGVCSVSDLPDPMKAGTLPKRNIYRRSTKVENDENRSSLWTFVDLQGKLLVEYQFEQCGDFSEGLAAVCRDGAWGFINNTGHWVITPKYDMDTQVRYRFRNGLALVRFHGQWGFIDKSGRQVIPAVYDEAREFCEGLAAVKVKRFWGFLDRSGHFVIPPSYHQAGDFHEGVAFAKKSDRDYSEDCGSDCLFGFIDKKGAWTIPPRFALASDFSEGMAAVTERASGEYLWGYINTSGSLVIPARFSTPKSFKNGMAYVLKNGAGMYIDRNGKVLFRPSSTASSNEVAPDERYKFGFAVERGPGGLCGFKDTKRRWAVKPEYEQVSTFSKAYDNEP